MPNDRSWSASNGAPCDYTSGWAGVGCNVWGRITRVDAGEMERLGVSRTGIRGDISGWEVLTEAEYMCVHCPLRNDHVAAPLPRMGLLPLPTHILLVESCPNTKAWRAYRAPAYP